MWLWHASYGYAGTMNDISIFNISPLFRKMMDGSFAALEAESGVVPFQVGDKIVNQMYCLVDGIYPSMTRFVRAYSEPVTESEKRFTAWQESARKDIERAFGVLKGRWQCLDRPQFFINLNRIADRVCCCLILHNMCISDRVMQDVRARYNPTESVEELIERRIIFPKDLFDKQGPTAERDRSQVGLTNIGGDAQTLVNSRARFEFMKNQEVTKQLHEAIISQF
jgi:Plant transposon protein